MHAIIIRTGRDVDRYVLWSRVLEGPLHVGDRAFIAGILRRERATSADDVSTSLLPDYQDADERVRVHTAAVAALRPETVEQRLDRVDRVGTSAADPHRSPTAVQVGAYDAPGLRVRGTLWLPRERFDGYALGLAEGGTDSDTAAALLEPWEGQPQW